MTKKVIEPRKEAELTLSFAKKSSADLIKSTKKLTGYRLPSSLVSELLGVAYTQIRNPDSNLSLLGRS